MKLALSLVLVTIALTLLAIYHRSFPVLALAAFFLVVAWARVHVWRRAHRCHDFIRLEKLSQHHQRNGNPAVALCQIKSGVVERRTLWRVKCRDCGKLSMGLTMRIVKVADI